MRRTGSAFDERLVELIGSLVGYTTAAVLVQSGLLGMGPSNAVARESERRAAVEQTCRLAIAQMAECRIAAELLISEHAEQYAGTLLPALDRFQLELVAGDAQSAIEALAQINFTLGAQLRFKDFPEFEAFMRDPETKLVL